MALEDGEIAAEDVVTLLLEVGTVRVMIQLRKLRFATRGTKILNAQTLERN